MDDILEERARLQGSLLLFTQVFYKIRTGREFEITHPTGRESHLITLSRELVSMFRGDLNDLTGLIAQIPPRYGKTELAIHFVAWSFTHNPSSNYIYTSYSHTLAKKQTQTIREIMSLPIYRKLFGIKISHDTSAKDNFETTDGGSVYAVGAGGTITGRGAGINGCDKWGGCIIGDDLHKPSEITSDTIRTGVNDWFYNTLQSRRNNRNTPIFLVGQSLHEDDLPANLAKTGKWKLCKIKALDDANNALNPKMHTVDDLLKMKELQPYVFASQYQQDPLPSGGGIFKSEYFQVLDEEPEILKTFITCDTAETSKTHNDPTAFSFFGIHKIKFKDMETDLYGLHWIDCIQEWIEPKDLENEFLQFMSCCMRHKVKPEMAAIEKKSTGVTLISLLQNLQGIRIVPIERSKLSGTKADRFLQIQPHVASKLISLPEYGKHTKMCIEHCAKITANDSHRFDDICDTLYDAIKFSLIDKTLLIGLSEKNKTYELVAKKISSNFNNIQRIRSKAYGLHNQ